MYYNTTILTVDLRGVYVESLINIETPGGAIYVYDINYSVTISQSIFFRCESSKSMESYTEESANGGTIFVVSKTVTLLSILIAFSKGIGRGQSSALICPQKEIISINCTCDVGCQSADASNNGYSCLMSTANTSIKEMNITDNRNFGPSGMTHIGNYPQSISISFVAISNTSAGFSFSQKDGSDSIVSHLFYSNIIDTTMLFGSYADTTVSNLYVSRCSGSLYASYGNNNAKLTLIDSYIGSMYLGDLVIPFSNVTAEETNHRCNVCALYRIKTQPYQKKTNNILIFLNIFIFF